MKIRSVKLDDLHHDPKNARSHNDRNLSTIASSLKQFGQVEPLVVQKGTGKVIGGNGRLTAMRLMGMVECSIVEVEADDASSAALSLALNRSAELAEWDNDLLGAGLSTLQALDFDLEQLGFSQDELAEILNPGVKDGLIDPDDVPEPPDDAITQRGDLWMLGDHRLLCGDSSAAEDVDRLLDGAVIHLVNTDPPYNVRVEPRSNNAIAAGLSSFEATTSSNAAGNSAKRKGGRRGKLTHHQGFDLARGRAKAKATTAKLRPKDRPLANDFVSDEKFARLLRAWFGNVKRVLAPGRGFYIWGGYANVANYPPVLKACELYFSQAIIWDKQHPVLTRKDYMGAHEWCFYGWREGAAHQFFGPPNVLDLWHVKKVNPQNMIHLTEKPVELAVRALQYSSRAGENVLDLFGGSGSTLIAAEQTGRRAFLMEIDPLYCDVIVERWEKFKGRKAEQISNRHDGPVGAET